MMNQSDSSNIYSWINSLYQINVARFSDVRLKIKAKFM